jgi:hypothetical protein
MHLQEPAPIEEWEPRPRGDAAFLLPLPLAEGWGKGVGLHESTDRRQALPSP